MIQIAPKTPEGLTYVRKRLDELRIKFQVLGFDIILKDEIEYNLEGHMRAQSKEYSLALASFNAALKLNNSFELAWANKGHVYFQLKQYSEALQCFEKWSTIKPRNAEA